MQKTPCICADTGANPQHDPESLFMKLGDHCLRVWKDCRVPFPDAVIFVPEVVNDKNSRRHSRVEDFLGILEYFFLGRIFAHCDPRVVLWCQKTQLMRNSTTGWKESLGCSQICPSEIALSIFLIDRAKIIVDEQPAVFELKGEWFFAPHVATLARNQQRTGLISQKR